MIYENSTTCYLKTILFWWTDTDTAWFNNDRKGTAINKYTYFTKYTSIYQLKLKNKMVSKSCIDISSIIYKVYENKVHHIAALIAKLKKNIRSDLEDTKIYSQIVIDKFYTHAEQILYI